MWTYAQRAVEELGRAIGRQIERLRESPESVLPGSEGVPSLTAADLAAAAREIGVPWRISTVRAIEQGIRKVWTVEFLVLGEIFRRAWARKGAEVGVELNLFVPEGKVVGGGVVLADWGLREALSGRPFPPEALEVAGPEVLAELPPRAARLEPRWVIPEDQLPPTLDLRRLGREARGEAEMKLARKLGVPPEAVVIAAHYRWGMGLTQKRDEDLGDQIGLGEDTVRTKRGRITLRLGKDLVEDALRVQSALREADFQGRQGRDRQGEFGV